MSTAGLWCPEVQVVWSSGGMRKGETAGSWRACVIVIGIGCISVSRFVHWTSPLGKLPILWSFRHVCLWASFSAQAILPVYQYSAGRWDAMKVWIRCLDRFWRNMCRPDLMNWLIDWLCQIHTIRACSFGRTYFFWKQVPHHNSARLEATVQFW